MMKTLLALALVASVLACTAGCGEEIKQGKIPDAEGKIDGKKVGGNVPTKGLD